MNRRTFLGAAAATVAVAAMPWAASTTASPRSIRLAVLSRRYRQVLQLMAHGLTNHEIARALWISQSTVNHHVQAILFALNVETRAAAIEAFRAA